MSTSSVEHTRTYRERLRKAGRKDVLLTLPHETVALLDQLQTRLGFKNRSAVAVALLAKALEEQNQLTA